MIDTHAHIISKYYDDIDEVITGLKDTVIINCGVNDKENKEIIKICSEYTNMFGAIGIHPSEIGEMTDNSLKLIEKHINDNKIIAVGEIGLDYYYEGDYELQKKVFIEQLDLAKKYNKPVIIHSREANHDTFEILKKYPTLKKILHCYSYDLKSAKKYIEVGCVFGVNGIVTFKNNQMLVEVIKGLDLKHILLETDSPYLSPIPNRGKRNDSSNLIYIAEKIAEIKGLTLETVIKETTINAVREFDLDI